MFWLLDLPTSILSSNGAYCVTKASAEAACPRRSFGNIGHGSWQWAVNLTDMYVTETGMPLNQVLPVRSEAARPTVRVQNEADAWYFMSQVRHDGM